MSFPAELLTPRLRIRPWSIGDAAALNNAVARSLEHLVAFMPWASAPPMTLAERIAWIASPEDAMSRIYGMFLHDGTIVGGTGYHLRIGPGGLEIGYWVHVDHVGRGLATEATEALTDAGFGEADIDRIEIHHDRANTASGRIPEKLGYARVAEHRREIDAPAESGVTVVWRISRDQWAGRHTGPASEATDAVPIRRKPTPS